MRILFLSPVGFVGGAERVLLELLAHLQELPKPIEPHLLTGGEGPLLDAARALGAQAEALPLPADAARLGDAGLRAAGAGGALAFGASALRALPQLGGHVRALAEHVARVRPALVHSNGLKMHLLAAAAVRGPPLLWHLHDFLAERPLARRALWLARGRAAAALAVSRAIAEDARAALPGLPVHLAPNGVDTARFSPGPGEDARLDTRAGLAPAPPGAVRVGLVATYARWKGHDVFLQALARARARGADMLRGYLVGGPVYQTAHSQVDGAELDARIRVLGLAGHAGRVPFQAEPAWVYRTLDVVVHASTRPEPFGLTVVEAMACGRAVVVSRAGGAAELVDDGRDALCVPPGDVDALADALVRLAASAALRERLGARARETAVARHGRERFGRDVVAAWDAVLGGHA